MADTIDSISIELTASTQSAEDSIQKVIDKLSALKTAVTGASNFNKVVQGIARIAAVASGIDNDAGKKLTQLADGISALSKVGDLSNLKGAGKALSSVVSAVNGHTSGGKGLSNLAEGIRQTNNALGSIKESDVGKLGAVQDALSGEVSGSLHTSNVTGESAALGGMGGIDVGGSDVAASLGEIASSAASAGGELEDLLSKNGELSGEFETLLEDATQSSKALTDTGDSSKFAKMSLEEMERTIGSVTEQLQAMAGTAKTAGDAVQNAVGGRSIPPEAGPYETVKIGQFDVAERFANFKMSPLADELADVARQSESAVGGMNQLGGALQNIGGYIANDIITVFSNIGTAIKNFASSVLRIARYRMIRSMIRTITEGFSEGKKNLYEWSQAMDGHFAASMDRLATSTLYLKNALGTLVGPLMEALEPALSWIIDRIVDAINYFNMFVAAISGKSTYTAALRTATTWGDSVADSAGKAAKGVKDSVDDMKRTILGFDEINKLASVSDNVGGGGGSGGKTGSGNDVSAMFEERPLTGGFQEFGNAIETALQDTLSRITLIIGGAELAVGALLALSGANVPLGLGLMATGAVTMGSAIFANWEGIGNEVKLAVAGVEAALGTGMLAVGAVLAFSGANIPLGIGLMIAGLSFGVSAVTVAWNTIGNKMSDKIKAIGTLVGGATLGLGAVIAFAGHPGIGIAMMIAGASVAAISINWNFIKEKLQGPIGTATALIGGATLVLGILALIGGMAPLGIGLILAGAAGLATTVAANWDNLVNLGKQALLSVKKGWDALKDKAFAIAAYISTKASKLWDGIKNAWGAATNYVLGLWAQVKTTSKNIWSAVEKAWGASTKWVLGVWAEVKTAPKTIWNVVTKAWGSAVNWVLGIWAEVKTASKTIWNVVTKAWGSATNWVLGLWAEVKTAANTIWNVVKKAWGAATNWVLGIWAEVKTAANTIWKGITTAWGSAVNWVLGVWAESKASANNIWNKIYNAWGSATQWVLGIWAEIKAAPNTIWNVVKNAWGTATNWVLGVWAQVKNTSRQIWTAVSTAWGDATNYVLGVWAQVKTTSQTIWSAVYNAWGSATNWVLGIWTQVKTSSYNIWSVVTTAWGKAENWVLGIWTEIKTTASKLWNDLVYVWDEYVVGRALDAVANISVIISEKVSEWFKSFWTWINGGGEEITSAPQAWGEADVKVNAIEGNGVKYTWDGFMPVVEDTESTVKVDMWTPWNYWHTSPIKWLQMDNLESTVRVEMWTPWWSRNESALHWLQMDNLVATVNVVANVTNAQNTISKATNLSGSYKAKGGIFSNNRWTDIPQYAGGTLNAHGSLFLAGEAGPEIVGHVGGRTEVLNKSQLASAMYSAVNTAMQGVTLDANFYGGNMDGDINGESLAEMMEYMRADADAMRQQNDLLRQQNDLLRQINEKDMSVSTAAINRAQAYMNRRAGTTIVPVGT